MKCPEVDFSTLTDECGRPNGTSKNVVITTNEAGAAIQLEIDGVIFKQGEFEVYWHKDGTASIKLIQDTDIG